MSSEQEFELTEDRKTPERNGTTSRTITMSEKLKNAEYELSCLLDSLAHLQKSVEYLNLSYSSSEEHRKPGDDFTDVVYALGSLQMHSGTIDTLIERRIAKLKRRIRKIKRKAKLAQGNEAPEDR